MKKKQWTIIFIIVGIIILTLNCYKNIFVTDEKSRKQFDSFQLDSEDLVIGRMICDKYQVKDKKYGLQYVEGVHVTDYNRINMILNVQKENVETYGYKSQFGLQGFIFSFLYNKLHIPVSILHLICSLMLGIVLTVICYLLKEKYGRLFAGVFYITFLLSPWIIPFGKNLYWVEFTWFLPLMLCLLLDKTKNKKLFIPLIFLAVLFKCLCGYEYLSTILLTAITFFIADFFVNKSERKEIFKTIFIVGITCVLAFVTALCIHGALIGEGNIIQGVVKVFNEVALRKTIESNPDMYSDDKPLVASINASYIETIEKYFKFNTDILTKIDKKFFVPMCILSALILVYDCIRRKENAKRNTILYITFLLGTLSWFVLGKIHSYLHTHMNFVLWYFGYIQMCVYVIINFIVRSIRNIISKKKTNKVLIGYIGSVGSNICKEEEFGEPYDSKSVEKSYNTNPDSLI